MLTDNLHAKGGEQMTNTEMLRRIIKESGLKLEYIAAQLEISRFSLSKKIENETEFKASEIQKLCDVLRISSNEDKEAIFFAS